MKLRLSLLFLLSLSQVPLRAQDVADYRFVDSNAAFHSIAATGTRLEGLVLDDTSQRVDLPFIFRFGSGEYTYLYVSSNAQIGLDTANPTGTGYYAPNIANMDIIVPLGHDQNMNPTGSQGGGNAYWQVQGTSPNRRMVIEYRRLLPYTGYRQNRYTFQVHLLENGDIWFLYDTIVATRSQLDNYTFLRSHRDNSALFLTGLWAAPTVSTQADTLTLKANNKPEPGRCFVFHRESCQPVSQLMARVESQGSTSATAVVTWQGGYNNYGGYDLEYGLHGFRPGGGSLLHATATSQRLINLEPGRSYDIYVRGICAQDQYSDSRMVTMSVPCSNLSGLTTRSTTSAVFVEWNSLPNVTYRLEYGERGFTRGSGTLLTGLTQPGAILRNLQPRRVYDIYVEPVCTNGAVGGGMMCSTALLEDESGCDRPASFTGYASGRSAIFSWTPAANNTGRWEMEYGPAGFSHGSGTLVREITTLTLQLRNLTDTAYDFYLRARCSDDSYSDWTAPVHLEYPPMEGIQSPSSSLTLSVSPNPVPLGGAISVTVDAADSPASIELYDMQGRRLQTMLLQSTAGTVELSTTGIKNSGLYLLRITTEAGRTNNKVLVISSKF